MIQTCNGIFHSFRSIRHDFHRDYPHMAVAFDHRCDRRSLADNDTIECEKFCLNSLDPMLNRRKAFEGKI